MYSNTMMVLLNSRMVYGIANDTESNELSFVMTYLNSQVGVLVAHEQALEHPIEVVSVTIQTLISLNIEYWISEDRQFWTDENIIQFEYLDQFQITPSPIDLILVTSST